MNQTPLYKVNDVINHFTVQKAELIEELGSIAYELKHNETGAIAIQLQNDDKENTFVISLQTLPEDSTGVAHILEHIVLCGSKKFPVADPFFSMTRRSLNTFMNALTGADFTCYPAASKVEKDYFNLLEVYLDAVFHPLLDKMSFLQEGHRLEIKNHNKEKEALELHGIVYNEMKGAMSSNESRLWQKICEELYPDLPYRHNSGGEPADIASLSYEALIAFHKKFYTPSNAIFFFSGNISLEKNLSFINNHLLDSATPTPTHSPLILQKSFDKPKQSVGLYPCDDQNLSNKSYAAFAFLTAPLQDQTELLGLSLLDSILMDTDASPLKKALLDSNLCTRADSYMDQEMFQVPFAFVCQNSDPDKIDELEALLFKTLKELKTKPFDESLIQGAFLGLEFNRLEISNSFGPFALSLFWRSGLLKHHGIDIDNGLFTYSHLQKLKKDIADPSFFSSLIDKYFLNNTSYVRLVFNPSNELRKEESDKELASLKKQFQSMSAHEKEAILSQEKVFKKYQDSLSSQSIDCLPCLSLSDIPKKGEDYRLDKHDYTSFTLYHHTCFTNHIVYAELFMSLPALTKEELPYLKLLCDLLPNLGSGGRSSDENLIFINSFLGGFHSKLNIFDHWGEENNFSVQWSLGGKVMDDEIAQLFSLFHDTLTSLHLNDTKRIEQLLAQMTSALESSLVTKAMSYATTLSLSTLNKTYSLREAWYGLSYANFVFSIKKQLAKDPQAVIDALVSVWNKISISCQTNLVITSDATSFKKLEPHLQSFHVEKAPPKAAFAPFSHKSVGRCTGKVITSPVAFCSSSCALPFSSQKSAPFLSLATYMMENLFLHNTIREQGGAYGSGATYLASTNCFTLHSYRDPHIKATLEAFKKVSSIFTPSKITGKEMSEAILGMVQDSDAPASPGSRALIAYSYLMTKKDTSVRQTLRKQTLSAKPSDIIDAVQGFIVPAQQNIIEVVLSNQDKLSDELKGKESSISPCF